MKNDISESDKVATSIDEKKLYEVAKNPYLLSSFLDKEKTYEMCHLAATYARVMVNDNRSILIYIPNKYKDERMCHAAVINNGNALRDVPKQHRTYQICMAAVKNYGEALIDVPKELRDVQLCYQAVAENGKAFWHVPSKLRSKELALIAIRSAPIVYDDLPDYLKEDIDICIRALESDIHHQHFKIYQKLSDSVWDKIHSGCNQDHTAAIRQSMNIGPKEN